MAIKESNIISSEIDHIYKKAIIQHKDDFIKYIAKFIDINNASLMVNGPVKRLYFRDSDRDYILALCETNNNTIKEIIKKSDVIKSNWKITSDPFNIFMTNIVRILTMAKQDKYAEQCLIYLTFSFYASLQYKYFMYEPNQNIMDYTINNLSNKYKIKQLGTMFHALIETAKVSHVTYKEELIRGNDMDLVIYINALDTRLNSLVQNISSEFYKNKEDGKYMNKEEDSFDEENFYETNNTSMIIANLASIATMKTIARGIQPELVTLAAKICLISSSALRVAITNIINMKHDEIKTLFEMILQLYLSEGANTAESIKSQKFTNYILEMYIKSNTADSSILKIKDILDNWLKDCSVNYLKTERVATKINFRKATLLYFAFVLQKTYTVK